MPNVTAVYVTNFEVNPDQSNKQTKGPISKGIILLGLTGFYIQQTVFASLTYFIFFHFSSDVD